MTIDNRCREQQRIADQLFLNFKHTKPGSKEQVRSLMTLSFLIGMWSDFFKREEKRMRSAMAIEGSL
ncbi:MAG: hypothetical protein ACON4T_09410 [Synechococcus sp.]